MTVDEDLHLGIENDEWWFYDETGFPNGLYPTKHDAKHALERYGLYLEGWMVEE